MVYYVGIDVSLKESSVCMHPRTGHITSISTVAELRFDENYRIMYDDIIEIDKVRTGNDEQHCKCGRAASEDGEALRRR